MLKKIAAMLITVITLMLVIIVVCWPSMHVSLDCPDAHGSRSSSFSVPQPFSCFSLHLEGIDMFSRTILSTSTLLLLLGMFMVAVGLYVRILTIPYDRISFSYAAHSPPVVFTKQHRWLVRHASVY